MERGKYDRDFSERVLRDSGLLIPEGRMRTLRVGIASDEQLMARTLAIARGENKPAAGDPKIWFTSAESFARILIGPQPCVTWDHR